MATTAGAALVSAASAVSLPAVSAHHDMVSETLRRACTCWRSTHAGPDSTPSDGLAACRNDVWGARGAGCFAWLWSVDVHSLEEVADRIVRAEFAALL